MTNRNALAGVVNGQMNITADARAAATPIVRPQSVTLRGDGLCLRRAVERMERISGESVAVERVAVSMDFLTLNLLIVMMLA